MGAFTQKAKVQFALKCQKFARFQRRKPCKSGFKQIFLTYNYAKQVNATRNKVCKVCKQQMQLFFKLVVQVAVFFNGVSKGQCVQILCPALCTFPTRVFTSFWTCLLSATVLRQTFFQTCGASCGVFQRRFKRAVRANFCALQLCTFPTRVFTSF